MNKSAYRVAKILEQIAFSKEPQSLAEISKALDLPKSSTSDVINTLVECGYLCIADEHRKTYELSWKLFNIGSTLLGKTNLYKIARRHLEKLLEETRETVYLAIEDDGCILYIDKAETNNTYKLACEIGERIPMHCTGLGKALLAAYDEDKVRRIVDRKGLIRMTENTIISLDELMEQLEITRKRGYSVDIGESDEALNCVAAPIYDQANMPIAAISIASLKYNVNDEILKDYAEKVRKTALDISAALGYFKDDLY